LTIFYIVKNEYLYFYILIFYMYFYMFYNNFYYNSSVSTHWITIIPCTVTSIFYNWLAGDGPLWSETCRRSFVKLNYNSAFRWCLIVITVYRGLTANTAQVRKWQIWDSMMKYIASEVLLSGLYFTAFIYKKYECAQSHFIYIYSYLYT
jgi:hypothetical protein